MSQKSGFNMGRMYTQKFGGEPHLTFGKGTSSNPGDMSNYAMPRGRQEYTPTRNYDGMHVTVPNQTYSDGLTQIFPVVVEHNILTRNNFLFEIAPLKRTESLTIVHNRIVFSPTILGIFPERTAPRILQATRTGGKAALTRRGIGLFYTMAFLQTPDGRLFITNQLAQMAESVAQTLYFDIVQAMLRSSSYYLKMESRRGDYNERFYEEKATEELIGWDYVKKNKNPLVHLEGRVRTKMRMYGGKFDRIIADERIYAFVTEHVTALQDYYTAGPEGPSVRKSGVDAYRLVSGNAKIHMISQYDTGVDEEKINILEFNRQIGEYFIVDDRNDGHYEGLANYNSAHSRSVQIFSETDNKMMEIGLKELWAYQTRCKDGVNGGYFSTLNDNQFSHANISPKELEKHMKEDFLHYYNEKDKAYQPVRFLGHIRPNDPLDSSKKGEMPASKYIDMAESLINRLAKTYDAPENGIPMGSSVHLKTGWTNLRNVLDIINDVRLDVPSVRQAAFSFFELANKMMFIKQGRPRLIESLPMNRGVLKDAVFEVPRNSYGWIDLPSIEDIEKYFGIPKDEDENPNANKKPDGKKQAAKHPKEDDENKGKEEEVVVEEAADQEDVQEGEAQKKDEDEDVKERRKLYNEFMALFNHYKNQFVLPPFFATEPGLRTIHEAYKKLPSGKSVEEFYGFSTQEFKKASEAYTLLSYISNCVGAMNLDCLFADVSTVPGWYYYPNTGTAILLNLEDCGQHPTFFKWDGQLGMSSPSMGGAIDFQAAQWYRNAAHSTVEKFRSKYLSKTKRDLSKHLKRLFEKYAPPNLFERKLYNELSKGSKKFVSILDFMLEGVLVISAIFGISKFLDIKKNDNLGEIPDIADEIAKGFLEEKNESLENGKFGETVATIIAKNNFLGSMEFTDDKDLENYFAQARNIVQDERRKALENEDEARKLLLNILANGNYAPQKNNGIVPEALWTRSPLAYTPNQYADYANYLLSQKRQGDETEMVEDHIFAPSSPSNPDEVTSDDEIASFVSTNESGASHLPPSLLLGSSFSRVRNGNAYVNSAVYNRESEVGGPRNANSSIHRQNPTRIIGSKSLFVGSKRDRTSSGVDGGKLNTSEFERVTRVPRINRGAGSVAPYISPENRPSEGALPGTSSIGNRRSASAFSYSSRRTSSKGSILTMGSKSGYDKSEDEGASDHEYPQSPSGSDLKYKTDADFASMVTKDFEAAYANIVRETPTQGLVRVFAQMFVSMSVTWKALDNLIKLNIAFPFNFLILRPHMRYKVVDMVFVQGGGEAMTTYYNRPTFTQGQDPKTQTVAGAFFFNHGTVVHDDKHLFIVPNAMVVDYEGGADLEPFRRETYNPGLDEYGGGSIFVAVVPCTYKNYPKHPKGALSITGNLYNLSPLARGEAFSNQYPGSLWMALYWDFRNKSVGDKVGINKREHYVNGTFTPNAICFPGLTTYWDSNKNCYGYYRPAAGHWGTKQTYTGCALARKGREPFHDNVNHYQTLISI